ncbi:E3 ubiquitin-protein ligase TRIM39-like [Nothobranchius furzeri]|uniref:E3 ubiquitin-protein ligase TRIM39-like n=1 Tax=Nothobranchius furzeri TaxID=105023 RepID=A0A9D2Z2W7_NOTFU|nr:E3 ubiquitin-protein ligase TRIM39-like [Nothobranchius furzeri]
MALNGSYLSQEQFQCSICLDVFTNPSSTPCGHSFCMACITRYWDGSTVYQCPLCKKTFQNRPDLQINRTLREITDQFKFITDLDVKGKKKGAKGAEGSRSSELFHKLKKKLPKAAPKEIFNISSGALYQAFSAPGESNFPPGIATMDSSVPLLTAEGSPNNTSAHPPSVYPRTHPNGRRRFTVSGAAISHNYPLCDVHQRGIIMYCRSDQMCICPECEIEDHNDHDTVTVETEWMETKTQLRKSEEEIQEMISQRRRKIEEIKTSLSEVERAAEREMAGSVCLLSKLASAIERCQAELMEVMEMGRRAAENQAESMIRQLEREIEELLKRENALTELSKSDDHVHCVTTFSGLSRPPATKDWSGVSLNSDLRTAAVYRSLLATVEKFQEELKTAMETGFPVPVPETSLARTHHSELLLFLIVDVTLDFNTAHPRLVLSEDLKIVWCGERHHHVPDNAERFDRVVCVLGREAITSGKHYWEVEVNGKTDWDLGVARQSVNRKGKIDYTPDNGFWFLSLRDRNKYAFRTETYTDVQMNLRPHKIGIFVDYEKGEVSFYNVEAKTHIYTFHDVFTENIYPFFSPCTNKSGKNDMPLIITPVHLTDRSVGVFN